MSSDSETSQENSKRNNKSEKKYNRLKHFQFWLDKFPRKSTDNVQVLYVNKSGKGIKKISVEDMTKILKEIDEEDVNEGTDSQQTPTPSPPNVHSNE